MSGARLGEFLRFIGATAMSMAITLGLPILLHEQFRIEERLAVGIALAVAFVVNFVTTRVFVFKSAGNARAELARYVGVSLAFRLAEYGLFLLLFSLGLVYYVAQIIVLLLSFILKFLTLRGFVYGRRSQPGGAP